MADLDVHRIDVPAHEETYTRGELAYWLVGAMIIPLVPLLMVWIFTPWSGM